MTLKSAEKETSLVTPIMSWFYWSSNFAGQKLQGAHLVMSDMSSIGHQQERRWPLQLHRLKLQNFPKSCQVLYCVLFRAQKDIYAVMSGSSLVIVSNILILILTQHGNKVYHQHTLLLKVNLQREKMWLFVKIPHQIKEGKQEGKPTSSC